MGLFNVTQKKPNAKLTANDLKLLKKYLDSLDFMVNFIGDDDGAKKKISMKIKGKYCKNGELTFDNKADMLGFCSAISAAAMKTDIGKK